MSLDEELIGGLIRCFKSELTEVDEFEVLRLVIWVG